MKRILSLVLMLVVVPALVLAGTASGDDVPGSPGSSIPTKLGLRASIGTDITGGFAIGAGIGHIWMPQNKTTAFEFGGDLFLHKSTDNSEDGFASYEEKVNLTVLSVQANGLFNYAPEGGQAFFIAGFGLVLTSVSWEETETPFFDASQSFTDDFDGTSVGNVFNFGVGYGFTNGLELRVQAPMLFLYSETGGASSFVPTFTAGIQYRVK